MSQKRCCQCGEVKPLDEFHRNKNYKDGHRYECKACVRAYSTRYRQRPGAYKKRRTWETSSRGKAAYRRYRVSPKGKATLDRAQRKDRTRHPERYKANAAVNNTVQNGKLPNCTTQRCKDCGGRAQCYHHEDYSQPLVVVPLCNPCHFARHGKILPKGESTYVSPS